MKKKLYEFYIRFWKREFNSVYLLDVEKETAKCYFGRAVRLDKETGEPITIDGNFRIDKQSVGKAEFHRDYNDTEVYRARVFAESFDEAKKNAFAAFGRYFHEYSDQVRVWADEMENGLA